MNNFFKTSLLTASILFSGYASATTEFVTKKGQLVTLNTDDISALGQARRAFISGFYDAYKNLDMKKLQIKNDDIKAFLEEVFDEEEADLKNPLNNEKAHFITAHYDNKVVGFASFDMPNEKGEVYIRHLAVDSNYWQSGIGKKLVSAILDNAQEAKVMVLVTRRINKLAHDFYKSLNFVENESYIHEGLSTEKYVGFSCPVKNINIGLEK